ncbi:MAG TPA: hypothetical protein PKC45_04200 [Gemmatales bacterium]|nr:hypothetical protein [Gemmatales bacterium]
MTDSEARLLMQEADQLRDAGESHEARQRIAAALRSDPHPLLRAYFDAHFPLARPCRDRLQALETRSDPSAVAAALRKLGRGSDPRFIDPALAALEWLAVTGQATHGLCVRLWFWLPDEVRGQLDPWLKRLEELGAVDVEELRRGMSPGG